MLLAIRYSPAGITRELTIGYDLVKHDLSASMIPALLFALVSLNDAQADPLSWITCLALSCIYFFLFIYNFCLANQIAGIDEDKINKPGRVLSSGRLSVQGAWMRWVIAMVAFPLFAYLVKPELLVWVFLWQLIVITYNFGGLDKHWFCKNMVFVSSGAIVLLCPAWNMVQPLSAESLRWVLFVSIAFGITLNLQDLRDIAGDKATGRRTLPIAIGQRSARWICALLIAVLPLCTHYILFNHFAISWIGMAMEVLLAALNICVVLRILTLNGAKHDDKTYKLHTGWFCMIVLSAFFVIG